MDGFLSKPFTADKLRAALEKFGVPSLAAPPV
jgi:hypothetical protein